MTVLRTVRESPSAIPENTAIMPRWTLDFLVAAKVLGGSTETELGAADIQGTFLRLGIIFLNLNV
jgi:hypothetical protein